MKPIQIESGIWMKVTVGSDAEYVDVPAFITLSDTEDFSSGYLYMASLKDRSINQIIEDFKEFIKPYEDRITSNNETCCRQHSDEKESNGQCCKHKKSEK